MKKITKKIYKEKRAKLEKLRLKKEKVKSNKISSMKTMGSFRDLEDTQMKVGTKHHTNDYNYAPELVKKLKVMEKKVKMEKKKYEKKMKLETKKLIKKFEG